MSPQRRVYWFYFRMFIFTLIKRRRKYIFFPRKMDEKVNKSHHL